MVNAAVGYNHFDWSVVQKMTRDYSKNSLVDIYVVTVLRHPVDRAISHFYFAKRMRGVIALKNVTLEEYLADFPLMMENRGIWQDGQAGVSWLTGTHIGWSWVLHYGSHTDIDQIEAKTLNFRKMMVLAADRLESTFWFGISEEMDNSIKLLKQQLPNAANQNFSLPQYNKNPSYDEASEDTRARLQSLMPMDMWLYEYAVRLFHARVQMWETGEKNSSGASSVSGNQLLVYQVHSGVFKRAFGAFALQVGQTTKRQHLGGQQNARRGTFSEF